LCELFCCPIDADVVDRPKGHVSRLLEKSNSILVSEPTVMGARFIAFGHVANECLHQLKPCSGPLLFQAT
jgi:hypothetical protein